MGWGPNGNQCPVSVPTWLPKRVPQGFMERPFLCGFCSATETATLRLYLPSQSTSTPSCSRCSILTPTCTMGEETTFASSAWKRPHIKILMKSGRNDATGEEGLEIRKSHISVCNRVPNRTSKRPMIVKFVRRHTKFELMTRKKKLAGVK